LLSIGLVVEARFAAGCQLSDLAAELLEGADLVVAADHVLEVDDGLGGVETLRAAGCAVHNSVASVEFHGVIQPGKTIVCHVITRVDDPAVCLLQDGRSEVVLRVPPIRRARRGATGAEDALVKAVEQFTIVLRLVMLDNIIRLGSASALQPGLNTLVLVVEIGKVRHQILHDVSVGQRKDGDRLVGRLDVGEAGEGVGTVDVDGAGPANALAAGTTQGECGVHVVFDVQQGIQNHGTALLELDVVGLQRGLLLGLGIITINVECLSSEATLSRSYRALHQVRAKAPSNHAGQHFMNISAYKLDKTDCVLL